MQSIHKSILLGIMLAGVSVLGSCKPQKNATERPETSKAFPQPARSVSQIGDTEFSNEAARDEAGEAKFVMDWAGIQPGTTVADIGAGEGYYTIRLAERVGADGTASARAELGRVGIARVELVCRIRGTFGGRRQRGRGHDAREQHR